MLRLSFSPGLPSSQARPISGPGSAHMEGRLRAGRSALHPRLLPLLQPYAQASL